MLKGPAGTGIFPAMMIKRIISGIILVGLICAVISVKWTCALTICLFIGMGLHEFFTMLEKKDISINKYFAVGLGLIIPFSTMLEFHPARKWEFIFFILALLLLIIVQFRRKKNSGVIIDTSVVIFGILYVSWLFSFMIKIRYLPGGLGLLAALLLMTKLGDIGAYFVGSHFGKIPLLPRISPKKTVEGAIGGLVFSVIGAMISKPFVGLSYPGMAALGVALGILGQLGDLSESLMKRDCQIKDSGNILPGMGGILDEIDSLLFTAPAFYYYIEALFK